MSKLVLLRHGQSIWNLENKFTGWMDIDLSDQGTGEAHQAGKLLKGEGYSFDVAFTSVLKRAIRTLWIVLDEINLVWIPVHRSWRLNERHYGALQGLNKFEFNRTGSLETARTFVFFTIVFFELYQAFASRSTIFPSINVGLFKNKALIGATLISLIVAIGAVYLPSMSDLFGTAPLKFVEFLMVLLLSSIGFFYLEISKSTRSKRLGYALNTN